LSFNSCNHDGYHKHSDRLMSVDTFYTKSHFLFFLHKLAKKFFSPQFFFRTFYFIFRLLSWINFSNWFSIFYGMPNLLSYSFRIYFSLKLRFSQAATTTSSTESDRGLPSRRSIAVSEKNFNPFLLSHFDFWWRIFCLFHVSLHFIIPKISSFSLRRLLTRGGGENVSENLIIFFSLSLFHTSRLFFLLFIWNKISHTFSQFSHSIWETVRP
jgi:hypothetical protein